MDNHICTDCRNYEEFSADMDRVRDALDIVIRDMDMLFIDELQMLIREASDAIPGAVEQHVYNVTKDREEFLSVN